MSVPVQQGDAPVGVLEDNLPAVTEAVPAAAAVVHAASETATAAAARVSAADIVALGACLALGTGLAESGFWLVRKVITGELACLPGGLCWMAPLAQLAIFAIPTFALAVATRSVGKPTSMQVVVSGLSGLAWLNIVLLVPGLQLLAYLLLAGGLAAVTGRLAAAHAVVARRVAWHGFVSLAVLVAAVGLLWQGSRWTGERRMTAALPAAQPGAPNVLLLVLDTVRADALGSAAGQESLTPNIDRFARQGVVFEQAQSTAPWTLPAHASMFTSRLPHELTGDWLTPLSDQFPTLAEHLAAAGYATAGFVANTRYCSRETGLARGFAHYEDFTLSAANFALCTAIGRTFLLGPLPPLLGYDDLPGRKTAATVNSEFLNWQAQQRQRPFLAFLNYWDTHDPYIAPAPYGQTASLTPAQRRMIRNWWWMTKQDLRPEEIALARAAHEDCIRYLDAKVGQLLETLQQRGVLDNTLVIITSDHGEHFGEHGLLLHGNSLYEPLLHVPLVMAWPGRVPPGQCVSTPVSLGALPATISALVGAGRGPFHGGGLQRLWQEERQSSTEPPPALLAEIVSQAKFPPCHGHSPVARGTMRAVRIGQLKYILNGDGQEELYDLARDPGERENLAPHPAWSAALQRCRTALAGRTRDTTAALAKTQSSLSGW